MKRITMGFAVGLVVASVWAGSIYNSRQSSGHVVYSILPECIAEASDTIGPISLNNARYFSISVAMNRLTGPDTAIIDSGVFVRAYVANERDSSKMFTPITADSLVNFWGDDTLDIRTTSISKALTLPTAPWLFLVITRWDTNADTLDFKTAAGVQDSSAMHFSITSEK